MKGLALVVGAGGIGTQLAKDLNESEKDLDVVLCAVSYTHLTLPTNC